MTRYGYTSKCDFTKSVILSFLNGEMILTAVIRPLKRILVLLSTGVEKSLQRVYLTAQDIPECFHFCQFFMEPSSLLQRWKIKNMVHTVQCEWYPAWAFWCYCTHSSWQLLRCVKKVIPETVNHWSLNLQSWHFSKVFHQIVNWMKPAEGFRYVYTRLTSWWWILAEGFLQFLVLMGPGNKCVLHLLWKMRWKQSWTQISGTSENRVSSSPEYRRPLQETCVLREHQSTCVSHLMSLS